MIAPEANQDHEGGFWDGKTNNMVGDEVRGEAVRWMREQLLTVPADDWPSYIWVCADKEEGVSCAAGCDFAMDELAAIDAHRAAEAAALLIDEVPL